MSFGFLVSCQISPSAPTAKQVRSADEFDSSIRQLANSLMAELRYKRPISNNPKGKVMKLALAPFHEVDTRIGELFLEEIHNRYSGKYRIKKINKNFLKEANYVISGEVTQEASGGSRGAVNKYCHITASVVDLKTKAVAAYGDIWAVCTHERYPPLPKHKPRENSVGKIIVAGNGEEISKSLREITGSLLHKADTAYLERDYKMARALFYAIAEFHKDKRIKPFLPMKIVVNAYRGAYLANFELGNDEEAKNSFDDMVAVGVETDDLPIKFIFASGTAKFPESSGEQYETWIQQISLHFKEIDGKCIDVAGHAKDKKLAGDRAEIILEKMKQVFSKIPAQIIPLPSPNAQDIVEFKISDCDKGGGAKM